MSEPISPGSRSYAGTTDQSLANAFELDVTRGSLSPRRHLDTSHPASTRSGSTLLLARSRSSLSPSGKSHGEVQVVSSPRVGQGAEKHPKVELRRRLRGVSQKKEIPESHPALLSPGKAAIETGSLAEWLAAHGLRVSIPEYVEVRGLCLQSTVVEMTLSCAGGVRAGAVVRWNAALSSRGECGTRARGAPRRQQAASEHCRQVEQHTTRTRATSTKRQARLSLPLL